MKTKLYVGLKREGVTYQYADVQTIKGGALSLLDGSDKSGAARIHNVMLHTVKTFYDINDNPYDLTSLDYGEIKVVDTWKICREALKLMNNKDSLIFPEHFFCPVCSNMGAEKYTEVNEDWDALISKGFIDEFFLEEGEDPFFWTELPMGISIEGNKAIRGGNFTKIKRTLLDIGSLLKIQNNEWATKSESNMICSVWDATIVEIEGMAERDFNVLVRRSHNDSFCKNYLSNQIDIDAMEEAEDSFKVGLDAFHRPITCFNCGKQIGGHLDFTNFFQSLLSKKSSQKGYRQAMASE